MKIYIIVTCTAFDSTDNGWPELGNTRAVGYFTDIETARKAVSENWSDIHEFTYQYAYIDPIPEGLYNYSEDEETEFYKWNGVTETYEPIDKEEYPEWTKWTVGLTIG